MELVSGMCIHLFIQLLAHLLLIVTNSPILISDCKVWKNFIFFSNITHKLCHWQRSTFYWKQY